MTADKYTYKYKPYRNTASPVNYKEIILFMLMLTGMTLVFITGFFYAFNRTIEESRNKPHCEWSKVSGNDDTLRIYCQKGMQE